MGIAQRKAREKQELRQHILDAARELFVRDGYESVSMRKIAEKIEYAPATIYTYFKDKDDIFDCLCEETFRKLHLEKAAAVDEKNGDALESLKKGMETYIRFGLEHPEDYTITFILKTPRHQKPGTCETRKAKTGLRCFGNMRSLVQQCMEEGRIKRADLEETSQALWAGIHGLTALLITQTGFPFVEREKLIRRLIEILIAGLRPDQG